MSQQRKTVYRTNIGDNKYIIDRAGSGNNKRYHVLIRPGKNSSRIIHSGTDFGEACQQLFLDGKARISPGINQTTLQPHPV